MRLKNLPRHALATYAASSPGTIEVLAKISTSLSASKARRVLIGAGVDIDGITIFVRIGGVDRSGYILGGLKQFGGTDGGCGSGSVGDSSPRRLLLARGGLNSSGPCCLGWRYN